MRFKIMGLCLVAVFVMSAVVAATASATLPQFAFAAGSKVFSSKSGAGTLVAKSGAEVKCTGDTDTGEIEGPSPSMNVRKVKVSFTGCTAFVAKSYKCQTVSTSPEEITTNSLEGELGYIGSPSEKKVGLVLKPEAVNGLFASFECVATGGSKLSIEVRGKGGGGIIGAMTPVNTLINPSLGEFFTLTYAKGASAWEQNPNKLEVLGTTISELLLETSFNGGTTWELSAIKTTDEVFPLVSTMIEA